MKYPYKAVLVKRQRVRVVVRLSELLKENPDWKPEEPPKPREIRT